MPKNWKDFLRVNENKTELFAFLSHEAIHLTVAEGKEMYMQQVEVESSALLLVHKRRLTLDYFCMQQMLCKRGVGRATWKSFPEVTAAFSELLCMPSEVSEGSMLLLGADVRPNQ